MGGACCWQAGTQAREWEEQLQDLAKEHLGGTDGVRSRSEGNPDSPYGADVTITEPQQEKQSWLAGVVKAGSKPAKPTGDALSKLPLRENLRQSCNPSLSVGQCRMCACYNCRIAYGDSHNCPDLRLLRQH